MTVSRPLRKLIPGPGSAISTVFRHFEAIGRLLFLQQIWHMAASSSAARRPYIVSARVGPAGGQSVLRVATCVRRGGHGDGVERATRTRDHQNAIDATVDRESLVTTA